MQVVTAVVMPRSSSALLLSPVQANVAELTRRTLAADDLEEPDPPADTRPLSPAIAIVCIRSPIRRRAPSSPFQALIAKSA
jgi:hypothetical protein